ERHHLQRVVDVVHADDHVLGRADPAAAGAGLPGLDLLGLPAADQRRGHPRSGRIVEAIALSTTARNTTARGPVDPRLWRASAAMRRFLVATTGCGLVISGCTIASAVVLAHIVAGVITDPAARALGAVSGPVAALAGLWALRTLAHWQQGRLAQRGATAV